MFPKRSPAGGGQEQGAQGEDALGSFTGPLHAALAEPSFDKGFAGGFSHAAADGHGHGLRGAVVHPLHVVLEVGGGGGTGAQLSGLLLGGPVVLLEGVTGLFQPRSPFGFAPLHAGRGPGEVAAGMVEVEDLQWCGRPARVRSPARHRSDRRAAPWDKRRRCAPIRHRAC